VKTTRATSNFALGSFTGFTSSLIVVSH
jgi:hypothetical protein